MSIHPLNADEWSKKNLGLRGLGAAIVVSEPGIYKLIARSNKPEAKTCNRCVRHEVLPSIRKVWHVVPLRGTAQACHS